MSARQQYPNPNFYRQPQNQPPPQPPDPKYRFRWEYFVGIPLVIAVFLWLLNGIEPSFEFEQLMQWLDVEHQDRYVKLTCLGVLLIAITLLVKVFKNKSE
jgi:hypothetical protein